MIMNDEQISELIYQCRKAKTGVESVHSDNDKTYVNIVVHNRQQIAQIIRDLRMHLVFHVLAAWRSLCIFPKPLKPVNLNLCRSWVNLA